MAQARWDDEFSLGERFRTLKNAGRVVSSDLDTDAPLRWECVGSDCEIEWTALNLVDALGRFGGSDWFLNRRLYPVREKAGLRLIRGKR